MVESLVDMWRAKTPDEAFRVLRSAEVFVTNQSDKELQLPKILSLNKIVKFTVAKREAALELALSA